MYDIYTQVKNGKTGGSSLPIRFTSKHWTCTILPLTGIHVY